jgi:integrase/recombinase XerD
MSQQILSSTSEILLDQLIAIVNIFTKEELRQALSAILAQYDIKPAILPDGHPDLQQKIKMFLSGKRLEGLSPLTLESYALELRILSEHIHKATKEITTGDLRSYLGEFDHLKTSSISKRLSVLKSMFGWLASEEIIPMDPTRRIKPPKKE